MATPDTNPRPKPGEPEEVPAGQVPKTEREGIRVLSSRRRMKRGRLWFLIGAALILLVGGFFLWRYFASYESTDDAQVDVHLYPVSARISGYVDQGERERQPIRRKGRGAGRDRPARLPGCGR